MAIGKFMENFNKYMAISEHWTGEYVDYHLAAEPAPAPSTTAPHPQLSSPHHPGGLTPLPFCSFFSTASVALVVVVV